MSGEELKPGTVVAGQFEVERLVGSGGFARVYRARQLELDRRVALKVLSPNLDEGDSPPENVRKRFYREARLIARLQAPHTVTVYEYDVDEAGRLYMALEYIDGTTLDDAIEAQGPLSPGRATRILSQILKALGAAHSQGVLHRDIKPTNVMVFERFGETVGVKVLDFGITKSVMTEEQFDDNLTMEGAVIGTPRYMSPEQLQGIPVTPASDLFSAGLLLYEMYAGESPFETHDVNRIYQRMQEFTENLGRLETAPPPLPKVARGLLQPDSEQRYGSAEEVLEDLLEAGGNQHPDAKSFAERVSSSDAPVAAPAPEDSEEVAAEKEHSVETSNTVSFPLGLDPAGATESTELTQVSFGGKSTVLQDPPPAFSHETEAGTGLAVAEPGVSVETGPGGTAAPDLTDVGEPAGPGSPTQPGRGRERESRGGPEAPSQESATSASEAESTTPDDDQDPTARLTDPVTATEPAASKRSAGQSPLTYVVLGIGIALAGGLAAWGILVLSDGVGEGDPSERVGPTVDAVTGGPTADTEGAESEGAAVTSAEEEVRAAVKAARVVAERVAPERREDENAADDASETDSDRANTERAPSEGAGSSQGAEQGDSRPSRGSSDERGAGGDRAGERQGAEESVAPGKEGSESEGEPEPDFDIKVLE
jgi:serine/threonine-protein kinase